MLCIILGNTASKRTISAKCNAVLGDGVPGAFLRTPCFIFSIPKKQEPEAPVFFFRAPYGGGGFSLLLAYGAVDKLAVLAPDVRNALPIVV